MPTKAYTHSIYCLAKRQAARARRPHARTLTEALISDCLVLGSDRGRHVPYGSSVAAAAVIAPVAVPTIIAATLLSQARRGRPSLFTMRTARSPFRPPESFSFAAEGEARHASAFTFSFNTLPRCS